MSRKFFNFALLQALLMLALFGVAQSSETNNFSPKIPPDWNLGSERADEAGPASDDPKAHWGLVVEGFQLGLCLNKESFSNAEPISATVILRNVCPQPLWYKGIAYANPRVEMLTARGESVLPPGWPKEKAAFAARLKKVINNPWVWNVDVGMQRSYDIRLDQKFDLTAPGNYTAYVTCSVPKTNDVLVPADVTVGNQVVRYLAPPSNALPVQVTSGYALIQITPPPKPQTKDAKGP